MKNKKITRVSFEAINEEQISDMLSSDYVSLGNSSISDKANNTVRYTTFSLDKYLAVFNEVKSQVKRLGNEFNTPVYVSSYSGSKKALLDSLSDNQVAHAYGKNKIEHIDSYEEDDGDRRFSIPSYNLDYRAQDAVIDMSLFSLEINNSLLTIHINYKKENTDKIINISYASKYEYVTVSQVYETAKRLLEEGFVTIRNSEERFIAEHKRVAEQRLNDQRKSQEAQRLFPKFSPQAQTFLYTHREYAQAISNIEKEFTDEKLVDFILYDFTPDFSKVLIDDGVLYAEATDDDVDNFDITLDDYCLSADNKVSRNFTVNLEGSLEAWGSHDYSTTIDFTGYMSGNIVFPQDLSDDQAYDVNVGDIEIER